MEEGGISLNYENLSIETLVYESLLGDLVPEYALDWVEDIFVPGHPCYDSYSQMREAYLRVCARLGSREEDADLEIMVNTMLDLCRVVALEMFRYGRIYQKMEDVR